MIGGSGTHKGCQWDFDRKIQTGALMPVEELVDVTRDAVNNIWDERGVRLLPDEREEGEKNVRGRTVDSAIRLVTQYHEDVAPSIVPARVERPWVLHLEGYPFDLAGQIDLDEEISDDLPTGRIRDWKTRKVSPVSGSADSSIQLSVYAMAKKVLDGGIPAVALDFLVDLRRGPKIVTQESKRTERHFRTVLAHFEAMIMALERGVFLPTNPDNWWCSERFCGYWQTCKYTHH